MTEPRSSSKSPGSRWCAILFLTSFSRATKSQAGSSWRPITARHRHSAWWNESLAICSSSGDRHTRARISQSRSSIRRCALRMTRIGSSVLSRCRRISSSGFLFLISVRNQCYVPRIQPGGVLANLLGASKTILLFDHLADASFRTRECVAIRKRRKPLDFLGDRVLTL